MIERETEILPTIKHKNIVEYFGIDKMDTEIFIYMELLDNCKSTPFTVFTFHKAPSKSTSKRA